MAGRSELGASVADDLLGGIAERHVVVVLEAEGGGTVVVGDLDVKGTGGLADEHDRPHLQVGPFIRHCLHHGGPE